MISLRPSRDDPGVTVIDITGEVLKAATFDLDGNIIIGMPVQKGLPLDEFIAEHQLSIGAWCSTVSVGNGILDKLRTFVTQHMGRL